MDPYAVLGVAPGAREREITDAYRRLAKRWHPDRARHAMTNATEQADSRMAEINAAYDVLRSSLLQEASAVRPEPPASPRAAAARERRRGAAPRTRLGGWLPDAFRAALGPELLLALTDGEAVRLVTPASTWASPRAVLAVTERRLLWLLDDAPVGRVRTLGLREVAGVEHRLRRPRRRTATLTVHTHSGRRHAFSGLRPATAALIERQLLAVVPAGPAA